MICKDRTALYPFWVRTWHGLNALLYLVLTATGLSLHYANPEHPWLPFNAAHLVHNFAGIALVAIYLGFLVCNDFSGNFRHYKPTLKNLAGDLKVQALYYLVGIFRGDPHPFPVTDEAKFNPLQRVTYLSIMYVLTPVLCLTGLMLLFPALAPDRILGWGGIWPVAVLHLIATFFGTLFLAGHVYLATTGTTVGANFRTMVTGEPSHEGTAGSGEQKNH